MTNHTPNHADPKSRPDTGPIPGPTPGSKPGRVKPGPPTKHQLALMIWLAVFPTLTVLNVVLGDWLHTMNAVTRTFVLATIAVPIVIYGLMPQLHRLRGQLAFGGSTPGDQPGVGRSVAPWVEARTTSAPTGRPVRSTATTRTQACRICWSS